MASFKIILSPNNAPIHTQVIKLFLAYVKENNSDADFSVEEVNDGFKMVELVDGSHRVMGTFAVLLYLNNHFGLDMLRFGSTGSIERAIVYSYSTVTVSDFVENIQRFETEFICNRSFVYGHALTVADLFVFATLAACIDAWNKPEFISTKRYFNFIKNHFKDLPSIMGDLPEVKIETAPFEYKPTPEIFEAANKAKAPEAKGEAPKGEAPKEEGKKGESKKEAKKEKKAAKPQPKAQGLSPNCIDIRVGRIIEAVRHPEADKLYIEKIDVGEEKPRTIVSGLYQKIPLEKLQGSLCLVMTNLKPAVMVGVESSGMLLSAVTADGTQFDTLCIPEGSAPGERVIFTGSNQDEKPDAEVNSKKLRKYLPNFKTDDKGQVYYEGDIPHIARTSKGIITAPFKNGMVA